jgi:regulator of protease activity HflC (stomatin/prohibitin superfamily)
VTALILAFLLVYFWHSIFITIKSGEAGVFYRRFRGGTEVDRVYPEGFYVISPWDTMTIYNVRFQAIFHEMPALTKKGLNITIRLNIRYIPHYYLLGVLHQAVGPNYLNTVVIPEVEGTLRKIVGSLDADEVYTTQRGVIQTLVNEAIVQVAQRYVRIDDVNITEIRLPLRIQEAIETKLKEQQIAEAYVFKLDREKQEAERKRIEAGGIKDYNAMVGSSLTEKVLKWQGVQATQEIAKSPNTKVIIIGGGKDGLPVILDTNR